MTPSHTPRAGLLMASALAASLACTTAGAASYEGSALLGKLSLEVTDLTPDDALVASYRFNPSAVDMFVGSLAFSSIEAMSATATGGANQITSYMVPSAPLTTSTALPYGSPFDTMQSPTPVSAHGLISSVIIGGNLILSSVLTSAANGYAGYAEGVLAAVNLGPTDKLHPLQNSLLLAAHTSVTISGQATVRAQLADATACPGCKAEFTSFVALVSGDQFDAFIAADQSSAGRSNALQAAGIAFIGLDQVQLDESSSLVGSDAILTLALNNDSDSERAFSFFADGFVNAHSIAAASPVPEPESTSLALIGLVTSGIALRRRRHA